MRRLIIIDLKKQMKDERTEMEKVRKEVKNQIEEEVRARIYSENMRGLPTLYNVS